MRLNHVNLTVPDVTQTRSFFEKYFGFHCVAERGRDALAVLRDESGFILTLNNFDKAKEVEYPGAFHIGFMQESRELVDEIHARLKAAGFDAPAPENSTVPGPFTSPLPADSWSKSDFSTARCDPRNP